MTTTTRPARAGGAFYGLRALRSRTARLILLAQLTSQAGYFAFFVAQSWLALDLTNSPAIVSILATAGVLPFLFFSIPAGVLADRVNKRALMIGSRSLVVVAFLAEAALVASGLIQPWQMFVVVFIAGTGIVLDNPPQYKLLADSVPTEDIPSASALVSVIFQVSIIIGPLLGGLLLEAYGPSSGMIAVAVGNVLLIFCYLAIGIPTTKTKATGSELRGAAQGLKFVFTNRTVGLCAAVWAVGILVINPYQAVMSVFARDEIQTGGFGLGLLLTAPGIGALVGSTLAAYDRIIRPTIATMVVALALTGVAIAFTGWAQSLQTALLLLGLLGVGWGVLYVLANSITLMATPIDLRGRVIGVLLWMWGISPVGSATAGFVAGETNTRVVFALIGQIAVAFAIGMLALLIVLRLLRRSPKVTLPFEPVAVVAIETPTREPAPAIPPPRPLRSPHKRRPKRFRF